MVHNDIHAYIFTDYEGGNPVSAPGVGDNMPLVASDFDQSANELGVLYSPHLKVAVRPCVLGELIQNLIFSL